MEFFILHKHVWLYATLNTLSKLYLVISPHIYVKPNKLQKPYLKLLRKKRWWLLFGFPIHFIFMCNTCFTLLMCLRKCKKTRYCRTCGTGAGGQLPLRSLSPYFGWKIYTICNKNPTLHFRIRVPIWINVPIWRLASF